MISFCKSILDFLRIDLPLTFKNSLLLAAVYTFIIPVIRGISNLDNIHSADVFGQSLALIGVFLFIPIIRQELEVSVKEIVYTKVWSYRKSVSIRLICSFWMITVMITIFASIMRLQNCSFPFLKYVTVTILYAVFLGILGLLFSQLGNNVIIGYLASLGYWSFCQFDILTEENVLYIFPIISGEIEMGKLMIIMSINSFLLVVFFLSVKETRGMYKKNISLSLKKRYVMINPLTEILFVKDADSFVGQRNSLKITQNTTKQICMDSLVERLFFSYTDS